MRPERMFSLAVHGGGPAARKGENSVQRLASEQRPAARHLFTLRRDNRPHRVSVPERWRSDRERGRQATK